MAKRIGILTGGGDVPGLNPCIKAVVDRCSEDGDAIIGIRRGWAGLLNSNLDDEESIKDNTMPLNPDLVRTVARSGGTFLHTSRTNPARVKKERLPMFLRSRPEYQEDRAWYDCSNHILNVLEALKIDSLVIIGGDDTLRYAHRMHSEGVKVVAVPKTMDNDVHGTDYCIGFSTAVSRSVDYITQLRTTVGSHEQIGIVELFGRNSGETSLIASYLAGVDRAIISEVPFDPELLSRFLVEDQERSPSNYALVAMSEGARMIGDEVMQSGPVDEFGRRKLGGIGDVTADEIKRRTGRKVIYQRLGYLMRSGIPDLLDRMVSANFGSLAIELIQKDETGRLVAAKDGRYTHEDLDIVSQGVKRVDVDTFYDLEQYKPKVTSVLGKPMFLY